MTAGIYSERDAQRVVILRSDDGTAWSPDLGGGSGPTVTQRFDLTSTELYVGSAAVGSDEADPVWTVRKIDLSGGTPVALRWATNVAWTDRTTEEYS